VPSDGGGGDAIRGKI